MIMLTKKTGAVTIHNKSKDHVVKTIGIKGDSVVNAEQIKFNISDSKFSQATTLGEVASIISKELDTKTSKKDSLKNTLIMGG